jgi:hypothetical protein
VEHRTRAKPIGRSVGEHLDADGAAQPVDAADQRDDEALGGVQLRGSRG